MAGSSPGQELVPISHIADNPARIDEQDGVRMPVWFEEMADGGTPMCRATTEAERIVGDWISTHADGFPPIVIHITDGEATDGDPSDRLKALTTQTTSDGKVSVTSTAPVTSGPWLVTVS